MCGGNGIVSCYFHHAAADFLIHSRLPLAKVADGGVHHQVAFWVYAHGFRAVIGYLNSGWIGARSHDEVILQLPIVPVPHEIDTRIDAILPDTGVLRDIRAPLRGVVPKEVIDAAGQLLYSFSLRVGSGVLQLHTDCCLVFVADGLIAQQESRTGIGKVSD